MAVVWQFQTDSWTMRFSVRFERAIVLKESRETPQLAPVRGRFVAPSAGTCVLCFDISHCSGARRSSCFTVPLLCLGRRCKRPHQWYRPKHTSSASKAPRQEMVAALPAVLQVQVVLQVTSRPAALSFTGSARACSTWPEHAGEEAGGDEGACVIRKCPAGWMVRHDAQAQGSAANMLHNAPIISKAALPSSVAEGRAEKQQTSTAERRGGPRATPAPAPSASSRFGEAHMSGADTTVVSVGGVFCLQCSS
jgi:hypothetical protein